MFLKSLGERAVVELDATDCEMLARACRFSVGQVDGGENYAVENAWAFFVAAAAISRMHGWHNQPHEITGQVGRHLRARGGRRPIKKRDIAIK